MPLAASALRILAPSVERFQERSWVKETLSVRWACRHDSTHM
jgi:hypothetical protein